MNNNITDPTAEDLQSEQAAVAMLLAITQSTLSEPAAVEVPEPEDDLPELVLELQNLTSQVRTLEITLQNTSSRLASVRQSISRWMATNLPEAQPIVVPTATPSKPAAPKPRPLDNTVVYDRSVGVPSGGTPVSAEVAAVQRLGGIVL